MAAPTQAPTTTPEQQGPPSPLFPSESIIWYNVGRWGQLGFAVPNFKGYAQTANTTIAYFVRVLGRNLLDIMLSPDADMRTPPSINTLTRVRNLINRARTLLAGRALAPGTPRMEGVHAMPSLLDFMIYPCPFWRVRNQWMQEYASMVLCAISEACQHTENRIPLEITTAFAGTVGQYLQRILVRMSTELFGVDVATASAPTFTLSDAQLAGYNPGAFFTSTEMIDTSPPLTSVPPGNDPALQVLTDGIAASMLVGLQSWPSGAAAAGPAQATTMTAAQAQVAFVAAPGP